MVDLSMDSIIDIIGQTMFSGNSEVAGLVIMLAVFFVMVVILANLKAPPVYAMVPMMILAVVFSALGILDQTISFLIIIVSAVVVAMQARKIVGD